MSRHSSLMPANADYRRGINLVLSGFLCGVLWEFWNYWAGAKWHYSVPIMENLKIFEMPVPGIWVSRHLRSNVSRCMCSSGRS